MEARSMNDRESEEEREFLITGAKTYLDADDAMALFRRRIQGQIATLLSNRLDEVSRACGREWSANDLRDYTERQADACFIGKRLDVKNQGSIYIYLRMRRESKALTYTAIIDLYRLRQALWPDLWKRVGTKPLGTVACTGNNLFFHQELGSDERIPDFVDHLARTLDDFIAFMNECGGIPKDT
jgi:hypothetical protein